MKTIITLLNTSLKRIEDGNLDIAKLVIRQVITDLQNLKQDVVEASTNKSSTLLEKQSFKDYFINLIKDCEIIDVDEQITGEGEPPFIIKEYHKNGMSILEYVVEETKFILYQRRMKIDTTYLNQNTDIEIYGGTKKFEQIVLPILRDYFKLPVTEIEIAQYN